MIKNKKLIDSIDEYGRVVLSTEDVVEAMLTGEDVSGCYLSDNDEVELYNNSCKEFGVGAKKFYEISKKKESVENYFERLSKTWLIPKEYRNIDVVDYLSKKCKTEKEKLRLIQELEEFLKRDQVIIINLMIYLVDVMRKNNIVWGVGRGSSVACFILYLIGINKVNPLDYDIDYKEFFK
jgi:DNA polymerase III alpha subunit